MKLQPLPASTLTVLVRVLRTELQTSEPGPWRDTLRELYEDLRSGRMRVLTGNEAAWRQGEIERG